MSIVGRAKGLSTALSWHIYGKAGLSVCVCGVWVAWGVSAVFESRIGVRRLERTRWGAIHTARLGQLARAVLPRRPPTSHEAGWGGGEGQDFPAPEDAFLVTVLSRNTANIFLLWLWRRPEIFRFSMWQIRQLKPGSDRRSASVPAV